MPPMKPPQNPFFNPNGLSKWMEKINTAGAAQDQQQRRKRQASRRSKTLVEMVEELKKRPKR